MIGGYKIIDFKGVDVYGTDGAGVTIPGAYDKIEESHKTILVENLVYNEEELKPFFTSFRVVDSKYSTLFTIVAESGSIIIANLTIDDDDKVVVDVIENTIPEEVVSG